MFVADSDDRESQIAIVEAGAHMVIADGSYSRKINLGAHCALEPLLFLGADDLRFHPGWLDRAAARLGDGVLVVGVQDNGNPRVLAGKHATHFLVDRSYLEQGTIDRPGHLLHEGYRHNYCDDEFIATARKRRAYAFTADAVVEHLHPNWGKASHDDIYRLGESHIAADRRHHQARRRLWT